MRVTVCNRVVLSVLLMLAFVSCRNRRTREVRDDFKKYYEPFHVDGIFMLYDQDNDYYLIYNPQLDQPYTPVSTFKICNSLIGLETGVIPDSDYVIPWDSHLFKNSNWNRDHSLKSAFQYSTVWYYQELARRVGAEKMKYWLDTVQYGNADITGGIDQFWLTGGLRITPEEQIDFLKRLYNNDLPFSQRSMDIVKDMMICEHTSEYILSGKTGWGVQDGVDIGWYVGYVEADRNVYYFVNCIQSTSYNEEEFKTARTEIVYSILRDLDIIPF